jgi:hypothetical protein
MRSGLPRGLALVATVAAGTLLIACGGDDDELTKAQFIQQADAICKKGNQRIDAAAEQVFSGNREPTKAELEQFASETLIPDIQRQVDDVRALDEPSDDEDQVNAFLDSAQAELDKGKEDPLYMASDESFQRTNELGQRYGFEVCAED